MIHVVSTDGAYHCNEVEVLQCGVIRQSDISENEDEATNPTTHRNSLPCRTFEAGDALRNVRARVCHVELSWLGKEAIPEAVGQVCDEREVKVLILSLFMKKNKFVVTKQDDFHHYMSRISRQTRTLRLFNAISGKGRRSSEKMIRSVAVPCRNSK